MTKPLTIDQLDKVESYCAASPNMSAIRIADAVGTQNYAAVARIVRVKRG